jgi:hypothetical protein
MLLAEPAVISAAGNDCNQGYIRELIAANEVAAASSRCKATPKIVGKIPLK